jgi:Ca2+-binding EF-hand superfamily protein
MASKLTPEEFVEIKQSFSKIDSDGNGQISRQELREAISKKRGNEEVDLIMRLMDFDQDEKIDFSEYMKMIAVTDYKKTPHGEQFKQMFRSLDKDGDGIISADELKSLWNIFSNNVDIPGLDEVEDIMKTLDSNKDGKVEYEELVNKLHLK